jgi:predicted dinucleotide-binding enzyme
MRVGILGTGEVGKALATGFVTVGYEVRMGGRQQNNEKAAAWAKDAGAKASAGSFAEAASFGEVVVLATLGMENESALKLAGLDKFRGKVLIDATNPLDFTGGTAKLAVSGTDSGGERVQRLLPDAHVVKAFNTVGNKFMFRPDFPGGQPDMFIAGNADHAKQSVAGILRDFGWGVVDCGSIESSRYLEAMCMVWVLAGMRTGNWNQAFKLLRK